MSLFRRPLPSTCVPFESEAGRSLLAETIAAGNAGAFFPLVAQLQTQGDPAWCGLGSLVTALNALQIDPQRVWKGPWRHFAEELLICCKALEQAAAEGLTLDEVACLASCNGAAARVHRAVGELSTFRADLEAAVRGPPFLIVNYDRAVLGQTGSGHFSPIGAWHAGQDLVLILDVARFKYPPHWVPVPLLWEAMRSPDPTTGRPRGWLLLDRTDRPDVDPEQVAALVRRVEAFGGPCLRPPTEP